MLFPTTKLNSERFSETLSIQAPVFHFSSNWDPFALTKRSLAVCTTVVQLGIPRLS